MDAGAYTGRPDTAACRVYLGLDEDRDDEIDGALFAERSAQARVCRVPNDAHDWPTDLAEALMRRVARNLAARGLPLGFQATVSDVGVGSIRIGWDVEIRRLESPFRKAPLG
jgi:hypothetical protein